MNGNEQVTTPVELPIDEAIEVFKNAEGCEVKPLTEKDQARIREFLEKAIVAE